MSMEDEFEAKKESSAQLTASEEISFSLGDVSVVKGEDAIPTGRKQRGRSNVKSATSANACRKKSTVTAAKTGQSGATTKLFRYAWVGPKVPVVDSRQPRSVARPRTEEHQQKRMDNGGGQDYREDRNVEGAPYATGPMTAGNVWTPTSDGCFRPPAPRRRQTQLPRSCYSEDTISDLEEQPGAVFDSSTTDPVSGFRLKL